jgi:hypothetical protein
MTTDYVPQERGKSEQTKPLIRMGGGLHPSICSRIDEMVHSVQVEFGAKFNQLFAPAVVRMDARQGEEFEATKKPGVYVFLHEEHDWLKVGKSHLNASKRALEHCRDNTCSKDGAIRMRGLLQLTCTPKSAPSRDAVREFRGHPHNQLWRRTGMV